MAITFILIGVSGFLLLEKDSKPITFSITEDGVHAKKELYPYEDIASFWIFYEPKGKKYISLQKKSGILSHIKIPLGRTDPTKVRDILTRYLREEKHQKSIVDTLEDLF